MNIISKTFMGLGIVFSGLIIVLLTFQIKSDNFIENHEAYISGFINELSESWDITQVESKLSKTFYRVASTVDAQKNLKQFEQFGDLKSVSNYALDDYVVFANKPVRTGLVSFELHFDRGDAAVLMALKETNGEVVVDAFSLEVLKVSVENSGASSDAVALNTGRGVGI